MILLKTLKEGEKQFLEMVRKSNLRRKLQVNKNCILNGIQSRVETVVLSNSYYAEINWELIRNKVVVYY